MDRYEDMSMFQIIARTGTISAAANEMNVAPSAVSRRLKALEDRLSVQLVQRTTRRLTLTPSGESYLEGAIRLLGEVDDLEGGLQAGAGTLSGPIRITAPISFGVCGLPKLLDGFMRQHPQVELDINLTDAKSDLVADGYDLALRIGQLGNSSLKARRLCGIDFGLAASPAFLEQHPNLSAPTDLEGLPGCIYTNESQGAVLKWRGENGDQGQVSLTPVFRADNGDLLRDVAARGHGIVALPMFVLNYALVTGELVTIFDEYQWADSSLYAVYPPTAHMPARLRALIDHIAEMINKKEQIAA